MYDFTEEKNMTAIKKKVREILMEDFMEFLCNKYEEENVSKIGINEIALALGTIKDVDGFINEVCAVIKIVAKSWEDSKGDKRHTEAFNRLDAAEEYERDLAAKGVYNG